MFQAQTICTTILAVDAENVKAFFRRGTARVQLQACRRAGLLHRCSTFLPWRILCQHYHYRCAASDSLPVFCGAAAVVPLSRCCRVHCVAVAPQCCVMVSHSKYFR